jgi:Holliday junction DNA helicase RuvA
LTILSEIQPSSFALAIITNDVSKLVKIPGIGAKSAARIILELKDKLKSESTYSGEQTAQSVLEDSSKIQEASSALQVLGYTKKEIERVFEKVDLNSLELEEIIKKSLNLLGK